MKEQKKLHLYEFTVQRERREKKITRRCIVSILTTNYLIFTQKNSNKVLKSPVVKLLFVPNRKCYRKKCYAKKLFFYF